MEQGVLTYVPVDPTTKPGAVAVTFYPDVSQPSNLVGVDQLIVAATAPTFVQTPVWQETRVTIHKEDALKEYFDETSSDMRFTAQGLVDVSSASDIPADTTGFTGLGNLYFDYTYRFESPHLTAEVGRIVTTEEVLTPPTTALSAPEPMAGQVGLAATATQWGLTWVSASIAAALLPGYMGTIRFVGTDINLAVTNFPSTSDLYLSDGQAAYVRFANDGSGQVRFYIFADMTSAGSFTADPNAALNTQPLVPGQLYTADAAAPTGNSVVQLRLWALNEE
jgi:hypothetical protein